MEIEEYLKKFEPAAPPPGLKARVLAGARRGPAPGGRVWPLLSAAAALLVALWLVNEHAEERLRSSLARGESPARLEVPREPEPLLALLRKEIR